MSLLHCKTQATWENLFFTVPIIKLKMFAGYISIIGASIEAKTKVISISTLFSSLPNYYDMEIHFNKVWKFILISLQQRYVISHYPLSKFDQIWRLMGILAVHYNAVSKQYGRPYLSEIACTIFLF